MSFRGFSRSLLQSDWDQISWMPSSSWSMSLPTNDNDYDLNRIIQNSAPENPAGINRINIDQRQFGVDSLACHFWPQLRYTIPATSSGAYVEVSCSGRWRGRTCVFPPQIYGNLGKGKCSPQSKNGLRFQEFASHQQRFTLVNLPIRLKLKKSHKEIIYSHFLKTNGYPTQSFFLGYIYIYT